MHRRTCLSPLLLGLTIVSLGLLTSASALAQTYPRTRLENVTPPGAKFGSTLEVTLGGADLDDVKKLIFSDTRIKAEWIAPPKPKIDPKTKKPKKTPTGPPKFKITVPANVPIGIYDVRAVGKWGISNPRAFAVGDLKELLEKENNNDIGQEQKVDLNTTVSGVIANNNDVDYYKFDGKKGQRVVIYCAAAEIDSRLTPQITLYQKRGEREYELINNYDLTTRNAQVDYAIAADGEYIMRICQFAHIFGGSQAFYRLSVSTAPWIDAIYPPVVQIGKTSTVTVFGKNLPGGSLAAGMKMDGRSLEKASVQINPPMDPMNEGRVEFSGMAPSNFGTVAGFGYRVKNGVGTSNPVLLQYSKDPVIIDNGKNDEATQSQKVSQPCTICGRIDQPNDRDWYSFTAKRGEVYTMEGFAERLGVPCSLYLHVWQVTKNTDPKTKKVTESQTFRASYTSHTEIPSKIGRLAFDNNDPKGRFVVPADGDYRVMVSMSTATTRGGPQFVYRLNIRKEDPDFQVILVSNDTANVGGFLLHKGGNQEMSVIVIRKDGFNDEVLLEVDGLPKGVTCKPQTVGNRLKQGYLVLEADDNAAEWAGAITIKATATIDGKKVVRRVQPACLVWPAPNNVSAISRLCRSICVSVGDKGPYSLSTNVRDIEIPVGHRGEIKVKIKRNVKDFTAQVQIVRLTAPALTNGAPVNFPNVNLPKNKSEATIKYTLPTNAVPGTYNLVFQGRGNYIYYPDPKNKRVRRNTQVYEPTPPIKVVVYNKVGKLALANPKLKVKAGQQVETVIRVERLHKYDGEFLVSLRSANGFGGISASNMKIAKGKNDVQLVIRTAKNARVGTSPEFVVRATARVGNVTFTHETKFELTITKATAALRPQDSPVRTVSLENGSRANGGAGGLAHTRQE